MKIKQLSLLLLLYIASIANDTTSYSTEEILAFIAKPVTHPDITISTKGRAGYGTSELLYQEPKTDLYGGVLLTLDILSSADIRKRKEEQDKIRANALSLLTTIEEHLNLTWQYSKQRTAYKKRLSWHEKRIKLNLDDHSTIYPIEQVIIDLNTHIYKEQAEIKRAQLSLASLAGDKWEELYEMIQKWDREL